MKRRVALMLPLALGIAACTQDPVAPERGVTLEGPLLQAQRPARGTGIEVTSITDVSLPLVGRLDRLVVDQAVINEFLLDRVAGAIVGLRVSGTINGALGALGTPVVDQQFTSTVSVTPGRGGCRIVTIDLGPLHVDALSLVTVDVEPFTVEGRGSGAVGSLLCTLGNLVSSVVGGVTRGVQGVVNALNRLI